MGAIDLTEAALATAAVKALRTAERAIATSKTAVEVAEQAMARSPLQGEVGPQGPQGEVGPQGPQGAQGEVGPQGPQGEIGPQGERGADGARGPIGLTGARGPQGERGADGARGPQGERGPRGEKGEKGDPGPKGEKGDRGPMPRHRWFGPALQFELPNGTWGEVVDLRGPKGDRGMDGAGSGGGGSSWNPDRLPEALDEPVPEMFIVRQNGAWVRATYEQMSLWLGGSPAEAIPVTVNGEPVTVDSVQVTVTR